MTAGDDDVVEVGQHRPLRAVGRHLHLGVGVERFGVEGLGYRV